MRVNGVRGADERWETLRQRVQTALTDGGLSTTSSPTNSENSNRTIDDEFAVRGRQALCLLPGYDAEPHAVGQTAYPLLLRLADQLRERFTPYRYSVVALRRDYGWPVVYPPHDAPGADDLFLLGNALLVAPIIHAGATSRAVQLPAGRWYDFWNDALHEGGQLLTVRAPLERLPLFVRAGTALPLHSLAQGEPALCLRAYVGNDESVVYEDAGGPADYEQGNYRWVYFTCQTQPGKLHITRRVAGRYAPPYGGFTLEVIGLPGPPEDVQVDRRGAPVWYYENGRLEMTVPDDVSEVEITSRR